MKKVLLILIMIVSVITLSGCTNADAKKFKEDYEKLNNQANKAGKIHRAVSIDINNPFVYTTAEDIVDKINNKETFYVYFGDDLCPWCRSVIEKAIEVAKKKKVNKIYYVPIWDDDQKEILRDKYEIINDGLFKTVDGTTAYHTLLEKFDNVLSDYKIKDTDGIDVDIHEKRIYAPNFIYIKDGVAIKLTEGTSDSQKDAREELTKDLLKDEEDLFMEFFNN